MQTYSETPVPVRGAAAAGGLAGSWQGTVLVPPLPAAPQTEHPAGCLLLQLRNRLREVLKLLWELCGCTGTPQGSGISLSRGTQSSPTSSDLCGVAAHSQTR